jgi:hypothetical protein
MTTDDDRILRAAGGQPTESTSARLARVEQERDSLARRCAVRFEAMQLLRAELVSARQELERLSAENDVLGRLVADATALFERRPGARTETEKSMTMNYVQAVTDELADLLPGCAGDLLDLYALLALTRGPLTSLEDVHDAWSVWRNRTAPEHRSLIPFAKLAPEVQELDRKYMEAIHQAAFPVGTDA